MSINSEIKKISMSKLIKDVQDLSNPSIDGIQSKINKIYLSSKGITDGDVVEISKVLLNFYNLTHLYLCDNKITDASSLFQFEYPKLHTFDLSYNKLGDKGVETIAGGLASKCLQIKVIDLSGNEMGLAGITAIANFFFQLESLSELYLYDNYICDEGAKKLAGAIRCGKNNLTILDLKDNDIRSSGVEELIRSLTSYLRQQRHSIFKLDLRGNKNLDKTGYSVIKEAMRDANGEEPRGFFDILYDEKIFNIDKSKSVEKNTDDNNKEGDDNFIVNNNNKDKIKITVKEYNDLLDFSDDKLLDIIEIDIHENITNEIAYDISEPLSKCRNLTKIKLRNNKKLGNDGIKSIFKVLPQLKSLTELNLYNNDFTDDGVTFILDLLPRIEELKILNLNSKGITDKSAIAIAKVLSKCNLSRLTLPDNFGDKGKKAINDVLNDKASFSKKLKVVYCKY